MKGRLFSSCEKRYLLRASKAGMQNELHNAHMTVVRYMGGVITKDSVTV